MNAAEWLTLAFLPLAVMSDFSQLSSTSNSNSNSTPPVNPVKSGLIVFANQSVAYKCSYCPPLKEADAEYANDAQNPVLVDCDVEYLEGDKRCEFEGISKKTNELTGWSVYSKNPKTYCDISGER